MPASAPLGRQFAAYLCRLANEPDPAIAWAARLACQAVAEGQVCLRLADWAGVGVLPEAGAVPLSLPPLDDWLKRLDRSPLVGRPGDFKPLILDAGNRLYLATSMGKGLSR